jgi:hypothetical protein
MEWNGGLEAYPDIRCITEAGLEGDKLTRMYVDLADVCIRVNE